MNNTYSVQVGSVSSTTSRRNYSTGQTSYSTSTSPIMSHSVRHLVKNDGTMAEITGPTPVIIVFTTGQKIEFKHPVQSKIVGNKLYISGSNRPKTSFDLDSIKTIQIEKYNYWKTVGLYLGTTIVSLIVIAVFL